MMRANDGLPSRSADTMRRSAPPKVLRRRRNEPLLRQLLAEAHARIRVLEEALDRVKNAA